MKSINFQRNKSLIRVVNEPGKKKKKRNWDRFIYQVLLLAIVGFFAYYFVNKVLFVQAQGQVVINGTNVRLTDDARIISYNVLEGDSVREGDTLFCYAFNNKNTSTSTTGNGSITLSTANTESDDMWWYKEGYNLKKKISINKIEIGKNKTLMDNLKGEIKHLTNEAILDVLPKNRLEAAKTEIARLKSQNEKLESENEQLEGLSKTLRPFTNRKGSKDKITELEEAGAYTNFEGGLLNGFSSEILSELKYYKAPQAGVVAGIFVRNQETALKSDNILTIYKKHPTTIKAFFEQEDLRYFKVGDVFSLKFPDGAVSRGVLKRFYMVAHDIPDEFQKKHESTKRVIAADIMPVNSAEAGIWPAFHGLNVEVSKFKF